MIKYLIADIFQYRCLIITFKYSFRHLKLEITLAIPVQMNEK